MDVSGFAGVTMRRYFYLLQQVCLLKACLQHYKFQLAYSAFSGTIRGSRSFLLLKFWINKRYKKKIGLEESELESQRSYSRVGEFLVCREEGHQRNATTREESR